MKTRVFLVLSLLFAFLFLRSQRSVGIGLLTTGGNALTAVGLNLAGGQGASYSRFGVGGFTSVSRCSRSPL